MERADQRAERQRRPATAMIQIAGWPTPSAGPSIEDLQHAHGHRDEASIEPTDRSMWRMTMMQHHAGRHDRDRRGLDRAGSTGCAASGRAAEQARIRAQDAAVDVEADPDDQQRGDHAEHARVDFGGTEKARQERAGRRRQCGALAFCLDMSPSQSTCAGRLPMRSPLMQLSRKSSGKRTAPPIAAMARLRSSLVLDPLQAVSVAGGDDTGGDAGAGLFLGDPASVDDDVEVVLGDRGRASRMEFISTPFLPSAELGDTRDAASTCVAIGKRDGGLGRDLAEFACEFFQTDTVCVPSATRFRAALSPSWPVTGTEPARPCASSAATTPPAMPSFSDRPRHRPCCRWTSGTAPCSSGHCPASSRP